MVEVVWGGFLVLFLGLGMALGFRLDRRPSHVYVIMGDGELSEGQIWEAAEAGAAAVLLIVAAQTVWSSGVGASVGLEAGYTQLASGIASRITVNSRGRS